MLRPTGKNRRKNGIKWRGHEILRIEAFSDAVFAFAITLLVISLEVPKTFEELAIGMHGLIGFAICFLLLFLIWHEQYIFFRMYYLKDTLTIALNGALLFVVLCYVYPLKFLFSLITEGNSFHENGELHHKIVSLEEVQSLMIIYGTGFCLVYFVLLLLYMNAWSKRKEIELTPIEQFYTKSELFKQLILLSIGLLTILFSVLLPLRYVQGTGLLFFLIGPSLGVFYSIRRKKLKKKFSNEQLNAHEQWLSS